MVVNDNAGSLIPGDVPAIIASELAPTGGGGDWPYQVERNVDEITRLAAELGKRLQTLKTDVTTAESCTGGGIAEAITRIPGSSAWFEAGYVTYSNRQKNLQLKVPEALFDQVGAVSREVVEAMVRGAQAHSNARISP